MTIKAKLIGGFALVITLVAFSALSSVSELGRLNDRLRHLVDISSRRELLAARIQQHMLALHRAEKNMILAATDADMARLRGADAGHGADPGTGVGKLKALVSEEDTRHLAAFETAFTDFKQIAAQVREARQKNTNQRAFALSVGPGRTLSIKAETILRVITQRHEAGPHPPDPARRRRCQPGIARGARCPGPPAHATRRKEYYPGNHARTPPTA